MKHLVVINPKSFTTDFELKEVIENIKYYFESKDSSDCHIHISRYPRDAVNVVRKYLSDAVDEVRVYAVGGDGILFDCLNGMVWFQNAQLASVPYGTSNDFLRAFGEGKHESFRNFSKMAESPVVPTDLIYSGRSFALNYCSVGVESSALREANRLKESFGFLGKSFAGLAYFIGAALAILDKKLVSQYYEVTIDGKEYKGNFAGICVMNGSCYGGDKTPMPEALPNDGVLDVVLIKSASRLRLLATMPGYTTGRYKKHPSIISRVAATEVTINSKDILDVGLDGETFYDTSLTINAVPSALAFVAADNLSYEGRVSAK